MDVSFQHKSKMFSSLILSQKIKQMRFFHALIDHVDDI